MLDRIMTGRYPNLVEGAGRLAKAEGVRGFYRGWQVRRGTIVQPRNRWALLGSVRFR